MVKKQRDKKARRASEETAEDIIREINSAVQLVPGRLDAWQAAALRATMVEKEGPALKDLPGPSQPTTPDIIAHKENLVASKREAYKMAEENVKQMKSLLARVHQLNAMNAKKKLEQRMDRHELMLFLAQQAAALPLFISLDPPPELVGAIGVNDAYKLSKEDFCAAFVEDMWILGRIHGITEKGWYEVQDVDDPEKAPAVLPRRRVIPLPKYRADPVRQAHALFPAGAWVLALYPQTTVFYKGVIEHPPITVHEPYRLSFEDATYTTGFSPILEVPQRYVLAYRDVTYKPREKKSSADREDEPESPVEKEEETGKKKKKKAKKKEEEAATMDDDPALIVQETLPLEAAKVVKKKRKPKKEKTGDETGQGKPLKKKVERKKKEKKEKAEVEVKEEVEEKLEPVVSRKNSIAGSSRRNSLIEGSRRNSMSEKKKEKKKKRVEKEEKEEAVVKEETTDEGTHERTGSRMVCYRESFSDDEDQPKKKKNSTKARKDHARRVKQKRHGVRKSERSASEVCYVEEPSDEEEKVRRTKDKDKLKAKRQAPVVAKETVEVEEDEPSEELCSSSNPLFSSDEE